MTTGSPQEVFRLITDFHPDLILMDMYMPECTGIELSGVIRQMDEFIKIPIVFLSTEEDRQKQLDAMSYGADDFLAKSISTEHLISSVTIRAERMKMIRSLDRLEDYSHELERKVAQRTEELQKAFENLQMKSNEIEELNRCLERKVAEEVEKRIQNEQLLIQQSKMASMGELLGIIAHQWKQPLNAIGLIIQDMDFAFDEGEVTREYLSHVSNETMKQILFMSKTIDDFRNFLKPSKTPSPFDVDKAVKSVISLLQPLINRADITFTYSCQNERPDTPLIIKGYANEFKQVVFNIISNALDAIKDKQEKSSDKKSGKGMVRITCTGTRDLVVLKVTDNGGGIPEMYKGKIFDSYFSTKGEQGTGIGLYMAKTIIEENMDGKLYAINLEDGAEFTIELKRSMED